MSPDHRTTLSTRAHARGEVPFVMAGTGIEPRGQTGYDELEAGHSGLAFERGQELMKVFLGEQTNQG